jgi:protein involved in polysaccharide export with SLBB domain
MKRCLSPNVFAVVRRAGLCGCLLLGWAAIAGCASPRPPESTKSGAVSVSPEADGIREVYLSPGDEIRISVYGQPDLTRQLLIDPNGTLFFPLVGELNVTGVSVRQLRQKIAEKLSAKRDYTITAGDEIVARVYRHGEFDFQGIVPQNGAISLPLAGDAAISGLTLAQAGEAIAKQLTPFVLKPQVTVQVLHYQGAMPIGDPQVSVDLIRLTGEKFFVLGLVRTPGVFALAGSVQLVDAIATAGGMLPDGAAGSVLLIRSGATDKQAKATIIDLSKFLDHGDITANPRIGRGDIVYVPESTISSVGRFFAHVADIVRPFVDVETGVWLGQNISAGPPSRDSTTRTVVIPR